MDAAPTPRTRLDVGRPHAAGLAILAAALAWSPLLVRPAPSLAGPGGFLYLGVGDVVLQRDSAGCAPAVLAMLSRARGGDADPDALALSLGRPLPPRGLTLAQVADLARAAGVAGRWLRVPPAELGRLPLPFAAELSPPAPGQPGHLVLVRRAGPHGVLVADPEHGLVAWPPDRFASAWSGRAFVPESS